MKIGRNDPCPCGSGLKFKLCCGLHPRAGDRAKRRKEVLKSAARFAQRIKNRQRSIGPSREIVSADWGGRRWVAVGNSFYSREKSQWKTFLDFLFDYLRKILGLEWGQAELKKPEADRHPVVCWYSHVCNYQKLHSKGDNEIYRMIADGVTFSYFTLAYDLYVLQHNVMMQERLVRRLKHRDQFQGARYEMAVASVLIRAGCDLAFEDETATDGKHPEFVAMHRKSGGSFDVEAKSRHRQGILGQEGEAQDAYTLKLGVRDKLNDAKQKFRGCPFVAFVDANVPSERLSLTQTQWRDEIRIEVDLASREDGGLSPFSLVVVTNYASHYKAFGETNLENLSIVLEPTCKVAQPLLSQSIIHDIEASLQSYGTIPSFFPDPIRAID